MVQYQGGMVPGKESQDLSKLINPAIPVESLNESNYRYFCN